MSNSLRYLLVGSLIAGAVCIPLNAAAFDYLEHSYFGDRACLEAQVRLREQVVARGSDKSLIARYLAMGLACPQQWKAPYCRDGYKQLESVLNDLDAPVASSGDHSLTFGDFAALPDHLSQFGNVIGFARASQSGLMNTVLKLQVPNSGGPGGVISDVAEDACETRDLVDWQEVERDIALGLERGLGPVLREHLLPGAWSAPRRGPKDPAGAYSFDNPHYLDLVLQNHHHFGAATYASWAGFHTAAIGMMSRSCDQMMDLAAGDLEDLAEGLASYEDVDWDDLSSADRRTAGCEVLAIRIGERVLGWAKRADPILVEPVAAHLEQFGGMQAMGSEELEGSLAMETLRALMSLVFEGLGLHFLQDNVAGGHLRVERAAYGLGLARHMHDQDSRHGVVATARSRQTRRAFVAFGDSYLLGRSYASPTQNCIFGTADEVSGEVLSGCLLRRQRGLLLAQSTASLLHWGLGGPPLERLPCQGDDLRGFVCEHLPIEPTGVGGKEALSAGTLPQPPPPFAFQSLATSLSVEGGGRGTQLGLRLVLLEELGQMANWLTSYHFGLMRTSRPYERDTQGDELSLEFSYMFHWRWAARFLVNAGAYTFIGAQGLGRENSFLMGTGSNVGVTFLPEGWSKIPLELTFAYRVPLTLYNSRFGWSGRGVRVEAHWIEVAVGLAFM